MAYQYQGGYAHCTVRFSKIAGGALALHRHLGVCINRRDGTFPRVLPPKLKALTARQGIVLPVLHVCLPVTEPADAPHHYDAPIDESERSPRIELIELPHLSVGAPPLNRSRAA